MHHALKQEAIRLRTEEELSYDAIRKKLGVPKSTLHEWLKHFPLSRERILELKRANWAKNEAKIELYRTTMDGKKARRKHEAYEKYRMRFNGLSEDVFFAAGLMLYAAEGAKKDDYHVCIANTDVRIIKFFKEWLCRFFDVDKGQLRAGLHLYPTMDIPKEMLFWKTELGFEDVQFYKIQIRELRRSSFSYPESFRHGTCSLNITSVKKKTEIIMAIKAFFDFHLSVPGRA
jgi:transposase-like protein